MKRKNIKAFALIRSNKILEHYTFMIKSNVIQIPTFFESRVEIVSVGKGIRNYSRE